ncbi:helix-turn-helix domain-containing protein [Pannonibacter sp.]|uniref:helix-turn-helix domain-containing protein n=1 Tax=Pannonibacter sp. TaxID=1906786 RepID=UPI003F72F90D
MAITHAPMDIGSGPELPGLARRLFGNIQLDFETETRAATLQSADFGPCRLSRIDATAHGVRGQRVAQRSHDVDSIKLILQADGRSVMEQGGMSLIVGTGSMLLYDPTRPYALNNVSRITQFLLQVPRHNFSGALLQRLTGPHLFTAEQNGISRIVAGLVRNAMTEAPVLDETARARVGDTIVRLATSLILPEETEDERDSMSLKILRSRVKAYVEANLARPNLDVEEIAQRMGCSRRYIFRAFEAENVTPASFLWDLRLERAHGRLTDPTFRGSSISEVAYSCGFSSSAHFSRAFRKRYGCTPSQLRGEMAG